MTGYDAAVARARLHRASGRPIAWWGVCFLVVTEGMLFGLLLFVYFYLWSIAETWPPAGVEDPELLKSGVRSVLLFATSGTVWLAERAFEGRRRPSAAVWLAVTIVLAGVFLAGHVEELFVLVEEFTWRDHAYGSIYYTIVNFHAAHLLAGLLLLGFVTVRLGRGAYAEGEVTQLRTASLYWHFVDVIWAVVYTSLYLAPRFA